MVTLGMCGDAPQHFRVKADRAADQFAVGLEMGDDARVARGSHVWLVEAFEAFSLPHADQSEALALDEDAPAERARPVLTEGADREPHRMEPERLPEASDPFSEVGDRLSGGRHIPSSIE